MANEATTDDQARDAAKQQLDNLFEEIDTVIENAPAGDHESHLTAEEQQALVLLERAHDKLSEVKDHNDGDYPGVNWEAIHIRLRRFFTRREA